MSTVRKKRKFKNKLGKLFGNKSKNKNMNMNAESDELDARSNLQIINGSRKKKRIVRLCIFAAVVLVIVAVIIINSVTPTGIIEYLQNAYALRGSAKTPVTVYAVNADDFASRRNVACTVNDSYFELYNSDGKLIYAVSHGLNDANIRLSDARILLYDRDRYTAKIYNFSDELYERKFDNKIISADIGRDGTYAVVTESDKYYNSVFVFDGDNNKKFVWDCSFGYVIDVAVNNKGNKIAVAVITASGGSYRTKLCIISDNGKEQYSCEFQGLVSSLSSSKNYILASGYDSAYTVEWNGKGYSKLPVNGVLRYFDTCSDGRSLVVSGFENNEQNNSVTVISENGNVKNTFSFGAKLNDAEISERGIVLLGDDAAYIYEPGGKEKESYSLSKKPNFAAICDDCNVLILYNTELDVIR